MSCFWYIYIYVYIYIYIDIENWHTKFIYIDFIGLMWVIRDLNLVKIDVEHL